MIPDYNATFERLPGTRVRKIARTRLAPAGKDYPTLFLQIIFYPNPKTNRINPATVYQDVRIHVLPYDNYDPTNEFNAAHIDVSLTAHNEIVTFDFVYTLTIPGSSVKVSGGYKDFFNVEKEIKTDTRRGLAEIKGELNTVYESISASSYRM